MSSFKSCSDEDLEAVFYHLDFPKKCKFRRCSRRWNRLLRSAAVLHIAVFTLSATGCRLTGVRAVQSSGKVSAALQAADSHLVNLAFIGMGSHHTLDFDASMPMISLILRTPDNTHHERRLYLCSFQEQFTFMLNLCYYAPFDWIELRDVTLPGSTIRCILKAIVQESQAFHHSDKLLSLCQHCWNGVDGLALRLTAAFKAPAGLDGLAPAPIAMKLWTGVFLGAIKESVRHLTQEETADMLKRLGQYDEARVRVAFLWLLKAYEPDLLLSTELSLWTFDFYLCSPLVGRVLACYDDTLELQLPKYDD